jgi:uncharacterized protein (TIGR02266 family)
MKNQDMLLAFRSLDDARRFDPESLTATELETWDGLRREIEVFLFRHAGLPEADNRRCLRVPVAQSVRYYSRNSSEDRWIADLGEGGAFLLDGDPLPVGSRVAMEIEGIGDLQTLYLSGEVVWNRTADGSGHPGMGIQFTDLSFVQRAGIRNMMFEILSDTLADFN